jgi:uncharacterized protein (DUF362 family)
MYQHVTRRELLSSFGSAAAGLALAGHARAAAAAPASPVAVARCRSYDETMTASGDPTARIGYAGAEVSHWTHPRAIGAVTHLLARAGARRIRILECAYCTAEPLEEFMLRANWDPQLMLGAAPNVEFENTNWLGKAREYAHFRTPGGGLMFDSYDLNPSYRDCDVFVSLAKLKEHATCGVTLSMKNLFGITPSTIYGDGAGGKDAPQPLPQGGRGILHSGDKMPAGHREIDPKSPRRGGYRVPRIVTDLVAVRPIDLAIIDGVTSMIGGEGPWNGRGGGVISPGLLVAGTNPVCTDAVGAALMGFDPAAASGVAPYNHCDNHLRLAEQAGIGTCDLKRIEVVGVPIAQAVYPFRRAHS